MCLSVNTATAWIQFVSGEFDEAIEQSLHTLDLDPTYTFARRLLGAAYVAAGLHEEGIAELEKAAGEDCAHAVSCAWLAHAKAVAGHKEDARNLLRHLDEVSRSYVPSYHVALGYAALGEKDAAFAMLSRARDGRDPALNQLGVEPRFDVLSSEPRFVALLRDLQINR